MNMKIQKIYTPIKKCIGVIKHKVSHSSSESTNEVSKDGLEILGMQNKAFVRAENQVDPIKNDFKSTKELFKYAKQRCIDGLNSEAPYEHAVLMDTRQNKVLAEYKGDADKCSLHNLASLIQHPADTVLMHGHPDSYPLSTTDVNLLIKYNVNQIIAVDKNGEFSLAAKLTDKPYDKMISDTKRAYNDEAVDLLYDFDGHTNSELYRIMTHANLKHYANGMGLRYLTNYSYLKNRDLL